MTTVVSVLGPSVPVGSVTAGNQLRFSCVGFVDEGEHNLGRIEADGDGRALDHHLIDDGPADSSDAACER